MENLGTRVLKPEYDSLFHPDAPMHSAQNALAPQCFPGTSSESASTLAKLLKDNHIRYHLFFNDRGFHNHASHHLITLYALGATSASIEAAYKKQVIVQKSALATPEAITDDNFTDHLGDERYYHAYVRYFTDEILQKDVAEVIEKFIFSQKFNFDSGSDAKEHPQMLNRFLSGVMHPQIQLGYGVEFGIRSMIIEGLSQTAVHQAEFRDCLHYVFSPPNGPAADVITNLSYGISEMSATGNTRKHAFEILGSMLRDPRLEVRKKLRPLATAEKYYTVIKEYSNVIATYSNQWTVNGNDPKDVQDKMEQLFWLQSLIYGVGGWSADKPFVADFFCMHLVTSVVFIPSILSHISPHSKNLLLRSYFTATLIWYIARGRPTLSIREFYVNTTMMITPPGDKLLPDKKAINRSDIFPNPWFTILQSSLMHTDEHYMKLQRSLAHAATLYGARPTGFFANVGLDDAELLDGTLFLRTAILSADTLGWVREGQSPGAFHMNGLYIHM